MCIALRGTLGLCFLQPRTLSFVSFDQTQGLYANGVTALPYVSTAVTRWHVAAQAIGTAFVIGWSLSGKCDDKRDQTLNNLLESADIPYESYATWGVILSLVSILGAFFAEIEKDVLPVVLVKFFRSSAAVVRVALVLFGCAMATTVHSKSRHYSIASSLGLRIPVGMFSGTCCATAAIAIHVRGADVDVCVCVCVCGMAVPCPCTRLCLCICTHLLICSVNISSDLFCIIKTVSDVQCWHTRHIYSQPISFALKQLNSTRLY